MTIAIVFSVQGSATRSVMARGESPGTTMAFMGLTFDKILVILVIALILLGPERLPVYAKRLGELVRSVKHLADGAKDRLRDEMGDDFEDVDWKQLDPRQYDPRRIIRDALIEDDREARAEARKAKLAEASEARKARAAESAAKRSDVSTVTLNFDEEAT